MTPIESNQIIQAFTEVVRNQDYVFSDVSLDAITELQKTIAGIETEPPEVVAEAIREWFLDYEKVRNAVWLEEREKEISRVPKTKPENTVENRYRLLQEELEKLKEKKTPAQNPSEDIMPTEIANLFDVIRGVYSKHGFNLLYRWQDWPSLNKFYPSPEVLGDYWFLVTNEHNRFEEFISLKGSHPVLGSHGVGDNIPAFEELSSVLGLELAAECDDSNWLTYKGKKVRYWKITLHTPT
jgi:hypothetical protein